MKKVHQTILLPPNALSKSLRTTSNSGSPDEKKPPFGGFFSSSLNHCLAGSEAADAGAAGAAAGMEAAAAGASAAGAGAAAGTATGASSFLPQAARAAAAMMAANTSDLFILKNNVS
jgi:hypothetical protein